jgi:hypothetical protein
MGCSPLFSLQLHQGIDGVRVRCRRAARTDCDTYSQPALGDTLATLERLASAGVLRPVPARAWFFLPTHGAAAPYTLTALSARFDPSTVPSTNWPTRNSSRT